MTMLDIQFQMIMFITKVVNYKAQHYITHRVSESRPTSLFVFYTQITISSDHDQNNI